MVYWVSILFGMAMGSFANVCILRLPHDQSILYPASHCPRCGQALRAWHNIPILSFVLLRGRCAYCRSAISRQYILVESLMVVLFVVHAAFFQSWTRLIPADVLGFYLLCISIIDYRHRIIPDEFSLSLLVLGLAFSFKNPFLSGIAGSRLLESAAACIGGGLLMLILAYFGEMAFKKEALGGGDVKLIAASGAVLGWKGLLTPLFIGSLTGGVVALTLLAMKKKKLGETLPFGPFLSVGIYLTFLFPSFLNFP